MPVDSFKYLPRLITRYYKLTRVTSELPIPWMPLSRPLDQCRFELMTSAGLYHKGHEPPFGVERERREPAWATGRGHRPHAGSRRFRAGSGLDRADR